MKKLLKRSLILVALILVLLSSYVTYHIYKNKRRKLEIREVFLNRQEAIRNRNYNRIWDYIPDHQKTANFENDIEQMKIWLESHPQEIFEQINKEKIKKITLINAYTAFIEAHSPGGVEGYYLIKEKGKWKFGIFFHWNIR